MSNSEQPTNHFMADRRAAAVHQSTLRRKACSDCVKSKRRCDLILPSCSRCRVKGLRCGYVGTSSRATVASAVIELSGAHVSEDLPLPSPPLDDTTTLGLPYVTLPYPPMESISQGRIDFCVARLKDCLPSFVLENRTLFFHPLLNEGNILPLYQDALSICSLYLHRTCQNQKVVFQMLEDKVTSLISSSSSFGPESNLAELQVLLLYQIIRIFDGDARLKSNAERQFDILDSWTIRLHRSYYEAEQSRPSYSSSRHWILLESIRRTIMMSIFLRDLHRAMKMKTLALVPLRCTVPVSCSSRLWNRPATTNAEDVGQPPHLVSYSEFTNAWNTGGITSLDDYDKTLLAACHIAQRTDQFRK